MSNSDRVFLAENNRINRLRRLMEKKGVKASALINRTANQLPVGLSVATINVWLNGRSKTVRRDHLSWVFRELRRIPNSEIRVSLKKNHRIERIQALMKQKKLTVKSFLSSATSRQPQDFNAPLLNAWRSGHIKTAKRGHLAWVFTELRKIQHKKIQKISGNFELTAREVLMSTQRLVRNKGRDPNVRNPEDMLCGRPASEISAFFNLGRVSGLKDYGLEAEKIGDLSQFISAARDQGHISFRQK